MEGLRMDAAGSVSVHPGVFLDWNQRALDDPSHRYVLLVEELTRANLAAVLGELLTYLEYRDRPFYAVYSRRPIYVAKNLTILATYNPTDRSALEIDAALLRRLRILRTPPSPEQLEEMLQGRDLHPGVISQLKNVFTKCQESYPDTYEYLMPFGHGIFADVFVEKPDLHRLFTERLVHLLRRPLGEPHPFVDVIEEQYPWRQLEYELPVDADRT